MTSRFADDQSFLNGITEGTLAALRAAGHEKRYAAGEFVHRRGDHKPGMSVILSGRVEIGNLTRDGSQNILIECRAGHTFGEITTFVPVARTHDVVALENTVILQVTAGALRRLLQSHPEIGTSLLHVFARRLHLALETLENFRSNASAGRLASVLSRRIEWGAQDACIAVTQSALAHEIGVSRVTLGKLLKAFEDRGVLQRDYGKIHILDRDALDRLREPAD